MSERLLYLLPCPIADDTLNKTLPSFNKEIIESIDYFLVEELRTARRFLSSYKISKPISSLIFFELNKDTKPEEVSRYFQQIPISANIGIISEAGCPGIADPGALAVKCAHELGIKIKPLIGPSSIVLALMASGFSGQSFTFHGYLPIEKDKRIESIKKMEYEAKNNLYTQIFMETPYRNNALLKDLLNICQDHTLLCIATNITGTEEQIIGKKIKDWKKISIDLHKKPSIFLIY